MVAHNLYNITLVLHDFGGPIGFQAALRFPERIKKLVILNSWLWNSTADPDFIKLSRILKSPLLPFLYRYLNFSPRFVLPQSFGDKKLNRKLLKQYTKPFSNKAERNGALAFAHSLLNDQAWFETRWKQREVFMHTPILFIWGMKDPVIKPQYLQKFVSGFPQGKVLQLATSGHFPQEEEPQQVSEAIKIFINETS
jgi:haloalkane dehalogenase